MRGPCLVAAALASCSALGQTCVEGWAAPFEQASPSVAATSMITWEFPEGAGIVLAGSFGSLGPVPALRIGAIVGTQPRAMGEGLNNTVLSLARFDDGNGERLFAGGAFTHSGTREVPFCAAWDGAAWQPLEPTQASFRPLVINSLFGWNGSDRPGSPPRGLYAAGRFRNPDNTFCTELAFWDGAAWRSVTASVFAGSCTYTGTIPPPSGGQVLIHDDGTGFGPEIYLRAGVTYRWRGYAWQALPMGSQFGTLVQLHIAPDPTLGRDVLYAALNSGNSQTVRGVARFDGATWSAVGGVTSPTQHVLRLAWLDDGSGPALWLFGNRPTGSTANTARLVGGAWVVPEGADTPGAAFGGIEYSHPALGGRVMVMSHSCTTFGDLPVTGTLIVRRGCSCPADFNGDGQVDFFDYLDFIEAFAAEDPSADFNGDGQIDFFDYLDFIAAFVEGC